MKQRNIIEFGILLLLVVLIIASEQIDYPSWLKTIFLVTFFIYLTVNLLQRVRDISHRSQSIPSPEQSQEKIQKYITDPEEAKKEDKLRADHTLE